MLAGGFQEDLQTSSAPNQGIYISTPMEYEYADDSDIDSDDEDEDMIEESEGVAASTIDTTVSELAMGEQRHRQIFLPDVAFRT